MERHNRSNYHWELQEPPDEASFQAKDEADSVTVSASDQALLAKVKMGESLDAAQRIDLFTNVTITEDAAGTGFIVPERVLWSEKYGAFGLKAYGSLKYFKEHDAYGRIRFLQTNGQISAAIWAPHLYPFEEVDPKTGLPTILDRERCSFTLSLRRLEAGSVDVPRPREIAIHSLQGIFATLPNMGLSFSGQDYYNEFHWFEHDAVAQHVEWPEEESPHKFERHKMPLDFNTRKAFENTGGMQAFGEIWVPTDDLRRGIGAEVEFVMFQR